MSSKEYRDFVLEQLAILNPTSKGMMGEFLIYVRGIYFGGIFDDRFMVKITKTNSSYNLPKELPYANAKPMYLVENIDDRDYIEKLVNDTIWGFQSE